MYLYWITKYSLYTKIILNINSFVDLLLHFCIAYNVLIYSNYKNRNKYKILTYYFFKKISTNLKVISGWFKKKLMIIH